MNFAPINGEVLGAGDRTPAIPVAISQVFRLVSTLTPASTQQHGKAYGVLGLNGVLRSRVYVSGKLPGTPGVSGTVTPRVLRVNRGAMSGLFKLSGALSAHRKVRGVLPGAPVCVGALTPTVRHLVRVPIYGAFRLGSTVTGYDLFTGEAPAERTMSMPVEVRSVAIMR